MTAESYDAVPYPDLCYTQTHPTRLATIAALLGLESAPVERCRVLELGTAGGGNLIPMAYALPDSTFLGVDYAQSQVAHGQKVIESLDLSNIRLAHADIRALDGDLGQFDYVIAHGVYSWTPDDVREALLALCRAVLAPHGVAFISFNALPGWHNLLAVREMMLFHTRDQDDPLEKARAGRQFISRLAAMTPEDQLFGFYLRSYEKLLQKRGGEAQAVDELLLHDELETVNQPLYFHEFAAHAGRHGLQYLAEADFPKVMLGGFQQETTRELLALADGDLIALEQYMDFVRNRTLRQTLLVRADAPVERRLRAEPALLARFAVTSRARPAGPTADLSPGIPLRFTADDGGQIATDHPVSKAALLLLAENSPLAVPFPALLAAARDRLGELGLPVDEPELDAARLAATLLQGFTYSLKLVELQAHLPRFTLRVSDRPVASASAREQAVRGAPVVTSLRHERVDLDPFLRFVLTRLDGRHTVDEIHAALEAAARADRLALKAGADATTTIADDLRHALRWLARAALLEA